MACTAVALAGSTTASLVALFSRNQTSESDSEIVAALQGTASSYLPPVMRPSKYIAVLALPVNSNGKV